MKKIILLLIITIFLVQLASATIVSGYKHTFDYYAVTFDGEGDAIVSAQLNIENTQKEPIKSLTLEFPKRIILYDAVFQSDGRICKVYSEGKQCDNYLRFDESRIKEQVLSDVTAVTFYLPNEITEGNRAKLILSYKNR
ncbi:MAG: hypothetical protein V1859_01215 [archaeon]